VSEIKLTDQRPRTTTAEMPEKLRAIKPLPKDEQLQAFIETMREKYKRRMAELRATGGGR